jgi:hypothetical protein
VGVAGEVLEELGLWERLIVHQAVFEFEFEQELEECVAEWFWRAVECIVEPLEGFGEVGGVGQRLFVVIADFVEDV